MREYIIRSVEIQKDNVRFSLQNTPVDLSLPCNSPNVDSNRLRDLKEGDTLWIEGISGDWPEDLVKGDILNKIYLQRNPRLMVLLYSRNEDRRLGKI